MSLGSADQRGPWTDARFGRARMEDLRRGRGRLWLVLVVVMSLAAGALWVRSLAAPDWGPMLIDTREPSLFDTPPTMSGTLRITEYCTYVEADMDLEAPDGTVVRNGAFVIAWPESQVTWHTRTKEISYRDSGSGTVRLADGDRVVFTDGYYWGPTQIKEVTGLPVPDACPDRTPFIIRGRLIGTSSS